ncbi:MAG: alanine racemase [Planctomycetota bacterium]
MSSNPASSSTSPHPPHPLRPSGSTKPDLALTPVRKPPSDEPSRVEVDLSRIDHNYRVLSGLLGPGVEVCATVKKDAYGAGAVPVALRLSKLGASMFCVFTPAEAEQLVSRSVTAPILILMPVRGLDRTDTLYRHAVAERLHLTIHDAEQLAAVNGIGQRFGIRLPIHLYLDIGMSRAGLTAEQCAAMLKDEGSRRYLRLAGLYTHFSSADSDPDTTAEQHERFMSFVEEHRDTIPDDCLIHACNTSGLLRDPAYHGSMVRPGLGLLGYAPGVWPADLAAPEELKPVLRWVSRLIHVQRMPKSSPVGYASTHVLKRDSVLGVVPVGYGDGYPLALSNQGSVRVQPRDLTRATADCPVLGRVSMDQIVVDLTALVDDVESDAALTALMDAEAELYSDDPDAPHALQKLADLAGTHVYELLTRLNPAIPRRYLS